MRSGCLSSRRRRRRRRCAPALEAPAALAVALDAKARRAQGEAADRCRARDGVDPRIARLDQLGGGLGRRGVAEHEPRQREPARGDLQLRRGRAGAPVDVELGAQLAGERRRDDAAQIGPQRRQRQRGERQLDGRAGGIALAGERELAALGAGADQAVAAEDDRRGERPGDLLGVQRKVGERERSGRARRRIGPVEAAGVQRQRGDADAPRRRRCGRRRHAGTARCGRRARRACRACPTCGQRRARSAYRAARAARRQRHAGDGRRRAARPFRGEEQVDVPRGVARGDDVRRVDVDLLQSNQPLERAQLVDPHLDVADLEQLVRRRVDDLDAGRADDAGDVERELGPLLEGDDDVGVQRRRAQLRRQAARQVAEVGRDHEAVELQVQLAVAALGERRRRAGRIEAAAVEGEGEVRLDLDLALRRQRADEGNRQLEARAGDASPRAAGRRNRRRRRGRRCCGRRSAPARVRRSPAARRRGAAARRRCRSGLRRCGSRAPSARRPRGDRSPARGETARRRRRRRRRAGSRATPAHPRPRRRARGRRSSARASRG